MMNPKSAFNRQPAESTAKKFKISFAWFFWLGWSWYLCIYVIRVRDSMPRIRIETQR